MIREHDEWSKLGEGNLGPMNIQWAQRCEDFPMGPVGQGPMMLMKAILNDYWAYCRNEEHDDWSREKLTSLCLSCIGVGLLGLNAVMLKWVKKNEASCEDMRSV